MRGAIRLGVAALSLCALAAMAVGAAGNDQPPINQADRPLYHQQLSPPNPSATSWVDRWLSEPGMLGDWLGLRPALARLGIEPAVTFVSDVLGNPIGGRRRGLREFDNLAVDVDVALEKLIGAPGTLFHVGVSQRSGTSLSDIDLGNVFNVAQVCCGATFRLVNVYLEQPLLEGRLNVRGGRIAAGDEFLSSPLYWLFVQNGFDGNPVGIFKNAPGMTAYPTATWGLRARVEPVPEVYVMAGVFNGDPTLGENRKHGADWSLRGPVFAIAEIGYRLNPGKDDTGLPGNYKIGAYYDGGTYPDFLRDAAGGFAALSGTAPRTTRGKTGFYVLLDQMVYREPGRDAKQGLTPFVALLAAPDESVNQMPFFVNGGLVYRGLIPGRENDVAAFGAIYGRFSRDLRRAQQQQRQAGAAVGVPDYEVALEWTYVIQVARWLTVQPDVQYIVRPGGTGAIPNALVLGAQLGVTF